VPEQKNKKAKTGTGQEETRASKGIELNILMLDFVVGLQFRRGGFAIRRRKEYRDLRSRKEEQLDN